MYCFKIKLIIGLLFIAANNTLPCIAQNRWAEAIEDNSMLIEEAYNQEEDVIQHISNILFMPGINDTFAYIFTQEWPLGSVNHQISFTIPYISKTSGVEGIGDKLINYRYQLFYKNDWANVSPRLSLIIPATDNDISLGNGSYGMQVNLPVSKRWDENNITHFNLGMTYFMDYQDEALNFEKDLQNYFVGMSYIYLLDEKFNLMIEVLSAFQARPVSDNSVDYNNETIISPGFRCAVDVGNLQIVNAVSVPFTLTAEGNRITAGLFFYISFEHPI